MNNTTTGRGSPLEAICLVLMGQSTSKGRDSLERRKELRREAGVLTPYEVQKGRM